MPVIRTQRNMVVAYGAEDDDLFLQVVWNGPGEHNGTSPYAKTFKAAPRPLAEYQAATDWAVGIADEMAFPIHVIPVSNREVLDWARDEVAARREWAGPDRLKTLIATLCRLMRDTTDHDERVAAYDILTTIGIVQP